MIGDVSINHTPLFYLVTWIPCCRGSHRRRFNVFGTFVTHSVVPQSCAKFFFLTHSYVICHLLLNMECIYNFFFQFKFMNI